MHEAPTSEYAKETALISRGCIHSQLKFMAKESKNKFAAISVSVGIVGGVIMSFELAALRLLAPFLGTSIVVTTSILAFVLLGLALGNFYGGALADRDNSKATFAKLLLISAFCILLTGLLEGWTLKWVAALQLDLRLRSLIACFLLLFPASFCLGTISPFALRIKIESIAAVGGTAGKLSAWGTLGSLIGTIVTGFFLFSSIGTLAVIFSASALLAINALLYFETIGSRLKIVLLIVVATFAATKLRSPAPFQNASSAESLYARYWIVDEIDSSSARPIRKLVTFPSGFQSAAYIDAATNVLHESSRLSSAPMLSTNTEELYPVHSRLFELVRKSLPEATSALFIGGGTFVYPQFFLRKQFLASADVVELDPMLLEIAKEHFNFVPSPRMRIFHEDGRQFTRRANNQSYDALYLDAFGNGLQVPAHLVSSEAFAEYSRILRPDGILAINCIASLSGQSKILLEKLLGGLQNHFSNIEIFAGVSPDAQRVIQNFVFFASQNELASRLSSNNPRNSFAELHKIPQSMLRPRSAFTDDLTDIELLGPFSFVSSSG